MNSKKIKGLVVAAPASGSGKTTLTLGLIASLKNRGMNVVSFKIGPDFIDPGLHARITGKPARNLDGWMLEKSVNLEIFARAAAGADIAVVEGVMGLYDGYSGSSEAGSTAQMAKWLGLPVLLVADAGRMARSFAALVKGFAAFDPAVSICGVVANNAASPGHIQYLTEAMEQLQDTKFLGAVAKNAGAAIPERHLGLFTAEDHVLSDERINALASLADSSLDVERLFDELPEILLSAAAEPVLPEPTVRIAVAKDRAFCFYYEDNLDVLRENGCEIIFFSPLNDPHLPENIHGIYLGGGYPELYAKDLSQNRSMQCAIRDEAAAGIPVYAECGGFMYLCKNLEDTDGNRFEMTGIFDLETRMLNKLASLGYREIRLRANTFMGPQDAMMRGHEFHYSQIRDPGSDDQAASAYDTSNRAGTSTKASGWLTGNCLGSYVHLHFRSCPEIGRHFAEACSTFKAKRKKFNETS